MRYAALLLAAATLAIGPASMDACAASGRGCCRICSAGKACGNSCIARSKTCHKGKGCACDG
ncbi:MAG TPA: hypothetical protein VGD66_07300 [Allosphingosinicella sp.]|jgi:hypothetical protein